MRKLTFLILLVLACATATHCVSVAQESSDESVTLAGVQVKLVRSVRLPAREPGLLERLAVKEGDSVTKGQVLAELDKRLFELNADISQVEKSIAKERSRNDVNKRFAEKSMEVSSAVVERSELAVKRFSKSISKTELQKLRLEAERDVLSLEQAELEMGIAEREVDLRDGQLKVNELKLAYRTLLAPFDGVIVETFPQEGEWINMGEPVLRIIDLDTLRIEAFVDGKKFDRSLLERKVTFSAELPSGEVETFEGKIDFVSPEVEPLTDAIKIRAEIVNKDRKLRPGQKGTLKILSR